MPGDILKGLNGLIEMALVGLLYPRRSINKYRLTYDGIAHVTSVVQSTFDA